MPSQPVPPRTSPVQRTLRNPVTTTKVSSPTPAKSASCQHTTRRIQNTKMRHYDTYGKRPIFPCSATVTHT